MIERAPVALLWRAVELILRCLEKHEQSPYMVFPSTSTFIASTPLRQSGSNPHFTRYLMSFDGEWSFTLTPLDNGMSIFRIAAKRSHKVVGALKSWQKRRHFDDETEIQDD